MAKEDEAGIGQDEAEARLEADNAANAGARVDEIAAEIPPADEPLDPGRLNTLADTIQRAAQVLSGGQVDELPIARVTEPQDSVPPDILSLIHI